MTWRYAKRKQERTHRPRKTQLPRRRVLPRPEDLLTLIVRPEPAHGVRHLT
jgi:hypothetical protein